MTQDEQKRSAAAAALKAIDPWLKPDSVIGVGTGSTANHFIDLLSQQRNRFDAAVASSEVTAKRLQDQGVRVIELTASPPLAIYVDGADEITPQRAMIKGGGGALTREKVVASAADRFICIVDAGKVVDVLGRFPLPIEVIPMARSVVARELVRLGGVPELRQGFTTDNGNLILDVHGLKIVDPKALEAQINNLPGVVCCGIFGLRGADTVIVGQPDGSVRTF
ncbi:MAG: ribose-5-phosphate isomerase RpiA [Gammaproteobacteria bacterium]|nr:ribose-5-phosphate isomerase RpiA [Gammaproteobacteria bacterium]